MTALPTASGTGSEAARAPEPPEARGEVSHAIRSRMLGGGALLPAPAEIARCSPYGEDLHLALHLCYELHYRGFAGVPDTLEWDPGLLEARALLEHRFESALRHDCSPLPDVGEALDALLVEPAAGTGVPGLLICPGE